MNKKKQRIENVNGAGNSIDDISPTTLEEDRWEQSKYQDGTAKEWKHP
jgi:hypothetical protein